MITGAIVIIDSVDQTANLTGDVTTCRISENAARTADFTLLLALGVSDLITWVGKTVVIKSVIDTVQKTEFTGVINQPAMDVETGLTSFTCTDNFQEYFETKTRAQIDALTPAAYWSESSFNESEGWEYTKERMSTIPSSIDMDELNSVRVTDWEAKAIPDYIITDADYIYGSLKINSIAERMDVINGIDLEIEYRYPRLKQREQVYSWLDTGTVCELYTNSYPLPTQDRVYNSILQTGWEITSTPAFTLPPPSGSYDCSLYGVPLVVWLQNATLAQGVDFSLARRYKQIITEQYTIRIENADSIAGIGDVSVKQTASLQTEYDSTSWDQSVIADGFADYGTPLTDINNDSYINKDDDTERQSAINTAVNIAKTRILGSHRGTEISLTLPYNQAIDAIHTLNLTASKLTAKAKISEIVKTINTTTGEALTVCTIKLSKTFGTGTPSADDPIVTPDGLPTVIDTQTKDINLLSHLGGQDLTVYDPNWGGWITDYVTITEPGHVAYPTGFVVNTPALTESIDNMYATDTALINVVIPDDILS